MAMARTGFGKNPGADDGAGVFDHDNFLGIMMAVKYGKNRRVAYFCLAGGVVIPVLLIVIQLMLG